MAVYTSQALSSGTTTPLIADLYEAAGALRQCGEEMAARIGQTQARWQLLRVLSEESLSMAQSARRLGVTRQSVQRVARELLREGLLVADDNPNHLSSRLLRLTDRGHDVLRQLMDLGDDWAVQVEESLEAEDVAAAKRVLRVLVAASQRPDA